MKKTMSIFLSLSMLTLTACSDISKKDPVTINTASSFGGDSANSTAYGSLITQFTEANSGIIVNDTSAKADDNWKELIRSQFNANKEPDVTFFFAAADARTMIDNKQVVPISTIRSEYPDFCSNIKPEAMENLTEFDGNVYAVPVSGFFEGLYYNKELFQKYNVPEITNWSSFIKAIELFNENGITPIAASFSDVPNYWIEHSILAASGSAKHKANPKSESELPIEWMEGITLLNDLYQKKAFQPDCLSTKHELAIELYNKGEAAMILEGSWLSFPPEIEEVTRLTHVPTLDSVSATDQAVIGGFSMGFYISTKAWEDPAKREACVKFVDFMTDNDAIAMLCVQGAPAADIDTINADQIVNDGIEMCGKYPIQLPIDSRLSKSAWEYLTSKISGVVSGDTKARDVLQRTVDFNK